jgi:hypothetical protein
MVLVILAFMLTGCMTCKNTPDQPASQKILYSADKTVTEKVEPVIIEKPGSMIIKIEPVQPDDQQISVSADALVIDDAKPVKIKKPSSKTQKGKLVQSDSSNTTVFTEHIIIGEVEPVSINKVGMTMSARIDTGAETSSLNATGITVFERDGKRWVKFTVKDSISGKTAEVESRLKRTVLIKWQDGAPEERPVVKLRARLGAVEQVSEFTLTDRSSFEYPVLIGRNFLNGKFIVDVNRKNTTSPMNEEERRDK